MSGWMSYFTGSRRNTQEGARDAIVGLRQQLLMLEKKEEHLNKKIDDEMKKARANASTNKRCEFTVESKISAVILPCCSFAGN
jgi:charged multivesicular body protein 4